MSVQGVVLACGGERRFGDLVTQDRPRHMLDLGFNPIVWHALQTLEAGGVKDVLLVARGDHAASRFDAWLKEGYEGGCDVEVITAPLRTCVARTSASPATNYYSWRTKKTSTKFSNCAGR